MIRKEISSPSTRVCFTCSEEKPVQEFVTARGSSAKSCTPCRRAWAKENKVTTPTTNDDVRALRVEIYQMKERIRQLEGTVSKFQAAQSNPSVSLSARDDDRAPWE